ncbi:energy-coupling factor transporter ATPase [Sporosarcina sp. GW1-11]|uniref:ABC transporter ATP-binding protein n=1 Tax=Sporosarcina sp. GW1-11 TaxID=2899126 RepID=UPI00294FAC50|nr:energy-coupling factor transporter ATPase [Sporosarcina sp. GW1-11]MDV6379117.1 energy-coupling factor transporter ATPase [Sporosarcina sp. GW1-11]
MELFNINHVSFSFPDTNQKVLTDVSLSFDEGEFVVIGGASGSGKTTLLKLLKRELTPTGTLEGDILYKGKPINDWETRQMIEEVGYVFQDPDNQIVMDEVMQEIVFGLENLGYSTFEMRKRVAEMVHFFGVEDLLNAKPSELSGGQKQILNLLSVLLMKPRVLLLDEPTSQLDPVAAKELVLMLERLNKETGMTIVLVEHRLEELYAMADRVVFMEQGKLRYDGDSRQVIEQLYADQATELFPYLPAFARLYMEFEEQPIRREIPLTVKECKQWIGRQEREVSVVDTKTTSSQQPLLLELTDVYFQYKKKESFVLKGLNLSIPKGQFFSLVGGNGSGKTTALRASLGSIQPQRGKVRLNGKDMKKSKDSDWLGKIAYLPQNPRTYFVQQTIEEEMKNLAERFGLKDADSRIDQLLTSFGISHLRARHPYDCSGGEVQKAALACILIGEPEMLFIDEPTKGMDPISKQHLGELLSELQRKRLTIFMVTHDISFAAQYAERCAMMFDGEIAADGTPDELFKGNYFYTTAINRATRETRQPEVLTYEEAVKTWNVRESIY